MVKSITLYMIEVTKSTLHMHNACVSFARFIKSMAPTSTSAYVCILCVYVCACMHTCVRACVHVYLCVWQSG